MIAELGLAVPMAHISSKCAEEACTNYTGYSTRACTENEASSTHNTSSTRFQKERWTLKSKVPCAETISQRYNLHGATYIYRLSIAKTCNYLKR